MKTVSAVALASSALLAVTTATDEFVGTIEYLPVNEISPLYFSVENDTSSTANSTASTHNQIFGQPNNYCMVALNIDFVGNDLVSYPGGPETCCGKCKSHAECAGYSWTNYQGGTCWLKTNIYSPKINVGGKGCAIIDTAPHTARFADCDMPGNDLRNAKYPKSRFVDCEGVCLDDRKCASVTWTDFEGGTCWFKTAVTNCVSYPGARTAVAFNEILF